PSVRRAHARGAPGERPLPHGRRRPVRRVLRRRAAGRGVRRAVPAHVGRARPQAAPPQEGLRVMANCLLVAAWKEGQFYSAACDCETMLGHGCTYYSPRGPLPMRTLDAALFWLVGHVGAAHPEFAAGLDDAIDGDRLAAYLMDD